MFYKFKQQSIFSMFTQPNPHVWGRDNVKKLQKPLTASQDCTSVSNAPNLQHVKMKLGKHGKSALLLNYGTHVLHIYILDQSL